MTIEAVNARARGLSTRREADLAGIGLLRRLDLLLLCALAATVAYGLWAVNGITRLATGDG